MSCMGGADRFLMVFCPFLPAAGRTVCQCPGVRAKPNSKTMAQQGRGHSRCRTNRSVTGAGVQVSGVAGRNRRILEFWFMNGVFIRGSFDLHNEDGGAAESKAYWQFFPIIQSKYGSPTKSASNTHPYTGVSNVWDGLQAPGSADKVQILLFYTATNERCGRGLCTSSFGVVYTNQTLQQRMASQTKDGL